MSKKDKIEIIITGGTIDSYFDAIKDAVVPLKESVLPSFIENLKMEGVTFAFSQVCMKDSRSLTGKDLNNILKTVEKSASTRIIITHGTYTMPDSARFLETNLNRKDQVIVFTGSMIPLVGFSPSDAPFNLGYALAHLKILEPGVHVCMNGQIFTPKEVAKRISEGRFVSIFNKN